jgi:hypothetical protein
MGLFFQDEWKITPRVTVSYGLRWDINGGLGDADKNASNFFPCAPPEPTVCAPAGFPNGLVRLQQGFPRLYNLDLKDLGPRAGLAWDIFGNGKTALRIGYSMAYDVANFSAISAPYSFQGARAGAFTNSNLGVFSVDAAANAIRAFCLKRLGRTRATTPPPILPPRTSSASVRNREAPTPHPSSLGANPAGTLPFNIFGTVPDLGQNPVLQCHDSARAENPITRGLAPMQKIL